jgi:hypothetical protein
MACHSLASCAWRERVDVDPFQLLRCVTDRHESIASSRNACIKRQTVLKMMSNLVPIATNK